VAEAEAAATEDGEKKKGGKKGLIIKIIPMLLVALVVAKMTVLKPPPLTPKQKADKTALAQFTLESTCAVANEFPLPKIPKTYGPPPTTTTTLPGSETPVVGPVLQIDSKTLNLGNGHFLKYGMGVQLPPKSVPDDVDKAENWGALASQTFLNTFSNMSLDDALSADGREKLRHEIGYDVCVASEGKASTVYFTEFVAQ